MELEAQKNINVRVNEQTQSVASLALATAKLWMFLRSMTTFLTKKSDHRYSLANEQGLVNTQTLSVSSFTSLFFAIMCLHEDKCIHVDNSCCILSYFILRSTFKGI